MAANRDPRSEAEKARADLKRNAEMDLATTMSPLGRQPSVTPETFGEHGAKARALSGSDQGLEAGGTAPADERSSGRSESIAEGEQVATGRDNTRPASNRANDDALQSKRR